jgi:hypothetical protein
LGSCAGPRLSNSNCCSRKGLLCDYEAMGCFGSQAPVHTRCQQSCMSPLSANRSIDRFVTPSDRLNHGSAKGHSPHPRALTPQRRNFPVRLGHAGVTGLREPEVKSASTANNRGKAMEKDWMQTQPAETPFQGLSDFSMQIKGLQTPCRLRGEKTP